MGQSNIQLQFSLSRVPDRAGSLGWLFYKDGRTLEAGTRRKIYPREWDKKNKGIVIDAADPSRAGYLGKLIAELSRELEELRQGARELENDDPFCTVEDIRELYGRRGGSVTLSGYTATLRRTLEQHGRQRTADAYRSVNNKAKAFNGGREVPLEMITRRFVQRFEAWMREEGKKPNTISFYNRMLCSVFNQAVRAKLVRHRLSNPFEGVYTGLAETQKRAVGIEVIDRILKADLSALGDGRLREARDHFMLSYYLQGISFIDYAHLQKKDLADGMLSYCRRKTGQRFHITVESEMEAIIGRYGALEGSPYLLSILKNPGGKAFEKALARQNYYLGRLSERLGLERRLTTYWARHSFASNSYAVGTSVSTVRDMLGHRNERTTEIYLNSMCNITTRKANRKLINALNRPARQKVGDRCENIV